MPPNLQESIMKAMVMQPSLPPAAANRSFIVLTFGGIPSDITSAYNAYGKSWRKRPQTPATSLT